MGSRNRKTLGLNHGDALNASESNPESAMDGLEPPSPKGPSKLASVWSASLTLPQSLRRYSSLANECAVPETRFSFGTFSLWTVRKQCRIWKVNTTEGETMFSKSSP